MERYKLFTNAKNEKEAARLIFSLVKMYPMEEKLADHLATEITKEELRRIESAAHEE